MLVTPTEVALLSHRNIIDVKAGEQHSLALGEEGDVYSWGSNR
jgi:alpha-tubulin suppressor-like RCC1 family protein